MANTPINPPLSNVQEELLKVFTADISENDLLELKKVIARFLLDKARNKADDVWDQKGYSDEKLKELLNK